MKKYKLKLLACLLIPIVLCSCSIGKKNTANKENKVINSEAKVNYEKKEKNKPLKEKKTINNRKEKEKENKLVLPEVEINGYGNKNIGDK